jgi:hypothetical protein
VIWQLAANIAHSWHIRRLNRRLEAQNSGQRAVGYQQGVEVPAAGPNRDVTPGI